MSTLSDNHQIPEEVQKSAVPPAQVSKGAAPPKPANDNERKSRILTLAQLAALPELDWLDRDFLIRDGLSVLYGQPGHGKTFFALDRALFLSDENRVVYIVGESPAGIKRRADAWLSAAEKTEEDVPGFSIHHGPVDMLRSSAVTDFKNDVGKIDPPKLVVVDTLARCFAGGHENDTKDMSNFVRACDGFRETWPGCAVLVLHHSGKDMSLGARGNTALKGAADIEMFLSKQGERFVLKNPKMKDAEQWPDRAYKLHAQGESAVLVSVPGGIVCKTPKPVKGSDMVLALLVAGPLSWSDLFRACSATMSDNTLTKALGRLKETGSVVHRQDGRYERATVTPGIEATVPSPVS